MPEGDTVKNTADALTKALAGQAITSSDFRVPALATADLTGWTVLECGTRGKHLLLRLTTPSGDARTLHSHLRMDGTWRTYPAGTRPYGRPIHTLRVVLTTATAVAAAYHVHDVAIIPTNREGELLAHLGPDLLGPDWDAAEAVRRLAAHPTATIGEALLEQRNLAGLGNLYKSEICFLCGISPWRPVAEVPDLPGLVALGKKLISFNVGRWTQITTGSARKGEETYVYGRPGRPCRRCGTLIKRAEQGERVTFWCPTCQS